MKKTSRAWIFILAILSVVMFAFIGCNPDSQGTDNKDNDTDKKPSGSSMEVYAARVVDKLGATIPNVTVTVKKDGETIAQGVTTRTGRFEFEALEGEYSITASNLPKGYSLVSDETVTTKANLYEYTFTVTSSVIKGETPPEGKTYYVGDVMYDFTVNDPNGTSYTLSEVLKTKKLVLINFWNIECGPCKDEMPYLELAYRDYKDQVEVLALESHFGASNPPSERDIREMRDKEYSDKQGNKFGLTFPMAVYNEGMTYLFNTHSIPLSVIVDQYGVIVYDLADALNQKGFSDLFDKYLSGNYTHVTPQSAN